MRPKSEENDWRERPKRKDNKKSTAASRAQTQQQPQLSQAHKKITQGKTTAKNQQTKTGNSDRLK